MKQYRQGDLLFTVVDKMPTDVIAVARRADGRLVLAEGEKTGHDHTILADDVELFEKDNGQLYLRVGDAGAKVEHQEHGAIDLPTGTVEVTRQQTLTAKNAQAVVD